MPKDNKPHTFKSRHFHFRPTTMTAAFEAAFPGAKFPASKQVREARNMVINPETGVRTVLHAQSN